MSAMARWSTRQVAVTSSLAVLLTLVILPLLVEGGTLSHVHRAHEAGIFNEEHVLATLAAVKADAPLSAVPRITAPLFLALGRLAAAPVARPFRWLRHSDPRAPPTL